MESNARKMSVKGLPYKLKTAIDNGAELTVKEWAEELKTSESKIRKTLTTLNQKWKLHRYYPVDGNGKQGIIVDITRKLEWMEQVLYRQELMFVNPQLFSFASWADVSITHLRKLLPKIHARLATEIAALTMLQEKVNQR